MLQNLEKKFLSVEFDSQSVYDGKKIKTSLKTFEDKVNTKFIDNETPKENANSHVMLILHNRKRKLSSSKTWAV